MELTKKENWWVWLLLTFFTGNLSSILLGKYLDCFDKKQWYYNYKYWLLGTILFIFPAFIMLIVLTFQMTAKIASKLDVKGREIYLSPYTYIICLIIPILGWSILISIYIYLIIFNLINVYLGKIENNS